MLNIPLDQITKEDIESLIENGQTENTYIEYKEILPDLKNDQELRRKFLRLVSSFANKSGGRIVYGIREGQDSDNNSGIPQGAIGLENFNEDDAKLKLQQSIRDGVSPILTSIDFKAIEGFEKGPILIVQIKKSWSAPHIINPEDKKTGFYIRANNQTIPMDYNEIRMAFLQSEVLEEKMKKFRDDRIKCIKELKSPVPYPDSPLILFHLIPFSFLNPEMRIDLSGDIQREHFICLGVICNDHRYNVDGFLKQHTRDAIYLQIFNSGIIEAASSKLIHNGNLSGTSLEIALINSTKNYLDFYQRKEISAPAVLFLSLLNVNGVNLDGDRGTPIDRDDVLFPEILIVDFSQNPEEFLLPLFNMVWQAGGYEKSHNYDENGHWIGSRR